MSHTLQIAINRQIVDKAIEGLGHALTTKFENVAVTIAELAYAINQGHPFCAQHGKGRRANANFTCSDILAVDIDDGMTLAEALSSQYIQQNAAIIYTTASHTDEKNKFRIVFELERTITDPEEMRLALRGAIRKFGGDESCEDSCRLFFGSKGSNPIVLANVLGSDSLAELVTLGGEVRITDRVCGDTDKSGDIATTRSKITLVKDQQVILANKVSTALNGLDHGTSIICPIHDDRRPSAYVVTNRHGVNGVHCRTCKSTFWPPSASRLKPTYYDFHAMESIIRDMDYHQTPVNFYDDDDVTAHPALLIENPGARSSHVFSEQYLPDLPFQEGVTLVRSPKGSGKSEGLSKIVTGCKEKQQSVLLIGHRQTLIQGIAKRLGLTCYFYSNGSGIKNNPPEDHYAICVDSIGKLLNPERHRYDVIIIDESEQVFSHLTADTLKKKRRACYLKMFHYLRSAKSVIVADADLGPITVEGLYQSMGGNVPCQFYLNDYRESRCDFQYYESENHLAAEMIEAIRSGGRHYVSTNSKSKADTLHEMIRYEFGDKRKLLLVTSGTTSNPEVLAAINNIKTEILQYDVVIASPTLGTGIDITFPREAKNIDTVFGFFMPRVNTHFDIDQQLSRVRHPKAIKVWVAPDRFGFEIEPDVIRREVIDNGVLTDVLIGYNSDATPILDETYLNVYAHVTSVQRASKNNLRKNLLDLRLRNGWSVQQIATDVVQAKSGNVMVKQAKDTMDAKRITEICSSQPITYEHYRLLAEKKDRGVMLSKDEDSSMRRHELERFYHEEISQELVALDKKGRYREQVRMMETYLSSPKRLAERATYERDAGYFASDATHASLKKLLLFQLFSAAGIADATTPIMTDVTFTKHTLDTFITVCQQHKVKIQELFGVNVRGDVKANAVQQLGTVLELIGLKLTPGQRQKVNGVTTYYYKVEESSWTDISDLIEKRTAPMSKTASAVELLMLENVH